MNKQKVIVLSIVLALMGATVAACAYMKNNRRLGNPGLKLVQKPSVDAKGKPVRNQSVDLPEKVLDYESKDGPISDEELKVLPEDTLFGRRFYQAPDKFWVNVSVVLMGVDSRSIHKPEICLPSQGWTIEGQPKTIQMDKPFPYDLPVQLVIGSKMLKTADGTMQPAKAIYVYWFVSEDELTADHLHRMWRMGSEMLRTGTLQRWAYVSCMAICSPGQEEAAYERVKKFIIASVPQFQVPPGKSLVAETASAKSTPSK
jgi:hypothetical protein